MYTGSPLLGKPLTTPIAALQQATAVIAVIDKQGVATGKNHGVEKLPGRACVGIGILSTIIKLI